MITVLGLQRPRTATIGGAWANASFPCNVVSIHLDMEIQDGTLVLTDLLEVLEGISLVLLVHVAHQHMLQAGALLAGEPILLLSSLAIHSNPALIVMTEVIFTQALHAGRDLKAEEYSACLADPHKGWTLIQFWAPMVLLVEKFELGAVPFILLSKLALGNSDQRGSRLNVGPPTGARARARTRTTTMVLFLHNSVFNRNPLDSEKTRQAFENTQVVP